MEINVFEENGRKEGVDQVDKVGEAEFECVIGVSRQVIINLILLNWWAILKKKEIIENMKVNTVLKKKKEKKTHRKQIINISIEKKTKAPACLPYIRPIKPPWTNSLFTNARS